MNKENNQRYERLKEKPPYYLIVHTNKYTGHFERKLIAYSFGILEEGQSAYAPDYIRAFWRNITNRDIANYEQYKDLLKTMNDNSDDYKNLYEKYLCYTYQIVDDWEQETFYNINSYYKNSKYNCDSIYIGLKEPLDEKYEKIIIPRIKAFFEENVYDIFEKYKYISTHNAFPAFLEETKPTLLDIDLIKSKDNSLVKKYYENTEITEQKLTDKEDEEMEL